MNIPEKRLILEPLCREGSETCGYVQQLDAAGKRWLLATNGHALLALAATEDECADERPANPSVKQLAAEFIGQVLTATQTTPWGPLRQLMTCDGPLLVDCRVCKTSLEVECPTCGHITDCESCDDGKVERKAEPVKLFSAHVNRVIFQRFATGLEAECVKYSHGGDLDPVSFADEGGSWVLTVMPMRCTESERKYGQFPEATP